MNKRIKRAAMFALSASLVMTSLAGCSKKADAFDADATVLTVNDEELSAGVVKFAVHYSQAQTQYIYDAYFGDNSFIYEYTDGYTIGDMVLESCIASFEDIMLAKQHAEEYGVELTEEEEAAISEAAAAFIEDNDEEVLEAISATQEIVEEYLTLMTIQNRVEVAMVADVDTEVSDEEAAQRRVQYVYVETEDETEDETEEETESEVADTEEDASEEEETAEETAVETEEETAVETDSDEESETALLTGNTAIKTTSSDETETESDEETDAAEEETAEEAQSEDTTEEESDTEEVTGDESEEASETEEETETETEDPEVAAAMARAYEKAEAIIALVQDGMTMEEAAAEIDEDLSVTETTFGADSTSVAEGLITATEDVEDETLVDYPIEATSGYYVAYVVSAFDEEATEEEKESIVEERMEEAIEELYEEWEEDSEITTDEDVLATITFDFNLSLYEEEETEEADTEEASEEESETEEASETESETGSEAEEASENTSEEEESASETEAVTESETESEEETAAETEEETTAETESETETDEE